MIDEPNPNDGCPVRMLGIFLAITFGLTWGIAAALIVFTEQIEVTFGALSYTHPLFILAVYSPGLAAVFLVWRTYGLRGLGRYFKRLTMWRMPAVWWAFLILAVPLTFYLGAAIKGGWEQPFAFSPWPVVAVALLTALFIGPIEEFGWHGLALPLLQRRMTPFWAGLLLGVIWAVWHLPAFALSGVPQSGWSLPAFFAGVVALSVIMTPLSNVARGSLLVAVLFHFQANGPLWPDAQPWDSLLFVGLAVIVVAINRKTMFTRVGSATQVLAE